jgi:hypothetical protein
LAAKRRFEMTTISHEPSRVADEKRGWASRLFVPEMWAFLAVGVIWVAVLLDAVFGPDIVSTTYLGDHTTVPSVVVVALFAFLATWVIARNGFRRTK